MKLDLLIQNGMVIDPANGVGRLGDIGVRDGEIAGLSGGCKPEAAQVVDASGCYVVPGIIDNHVHAYTDGTERGIYPDICCLPSGVTTCVDGGSAGAANYDLFRNSVIPMSKVRVKSYLNVCSLGLATTAYQENIDPAAFDAAKIGRLLKKYKGDLLGIKLRQTRNIAGEHGLAPLRRARELADSLGVALVVHVTDSPGEVRETLDLLRPGDIFCHVYHGKGKTILSEDGQVLPEVRKARERGVLFDAAHGGNQFSNDVARAALAQGFRPDFISSDISLVTMYKPPLYSMGHVMSKYLNLGIPYPELIATVTEAPARHMGMLGEIGTLSPGACADIAVQRIVKRPTRFGDSHGVYISGDQLLETCMTVREGVIAYRKADFVE